MNEALGSVLAFGVGVALSPIPIIAVILMLVSRRARVNGPAFILGWVLALAIIGFIVLVIVGPSATTDSGDASTSVSWLKVGLGVLLLGAAVRQWRSRPRGGAAPEMPTWMGAIDSFSPVKAFGAGALLAGVNPKNLFLSIGAAAAIAQADVSGASETAAYAVFVVIASIGVAAPVVIYFVLGDRAPALLGRLKVWMADHNALIMALLCLIFGVKLIGDGIGGF